MAQSWWKPWGARRLDGLPEVGLAVALEHQVWRVQWVEDLPRIDELDLPGAAAYEVLLRACTGPVAEQVLPVHRYMSWWVYRDGRYPVCSGCGEPQPCRLGSAAAAARVELALMQESAAVGPDGT